MVIKKIKQKQQDGSFTEYDLGAKSGNVIMVDGKTLEETVGDLIDRIDQKVDAWFYEGEPTLSNPPAVDWTDEDTKHYHIGDAYYDTLTWDAYRWVYLDGEYKWELILDDTASRAYKLAQENEKKINNMKVMTGASTETPGAQGFVPAPDKGSADRYLSSEGKWKEIVINDASPTVKGIAKLYAAVGEAVDGSMTQKAITDAVNGVKTTATDAQTKANGAINKLTLAGKVITWTKVNGDTGTLDLSYPILKGATSTVDGAAGLAPQPKMANAGQYLRGDGQWATPPNTTYQPATKDSNGLMSAADKAKLDGIANSANNYVHPSATAYESGLYKITTNNLGHVTTATSVVKGDITALGIPGSDTKYGTGTADTAGIGKLYTATGQYTDGSMTQKAITDALNGKLGSTATAAAASKLSPGKTIQTNLGLTTAATFDGTANVTPGVTGTLAITNGGTGRTDGKAVGWSTARQIRVNLGTTTAVTVDGTANKDLSVTGTLPIANGGTGATTSGDAPWPLKAGTGATGTWGIGISGNAGTATKLATPRVLKVALNSTASNKFDGSADQTNIGVSGVLPIANGGTGASDAATARANLGIASVVSYKHTIHTNTSTEFLETFEYLDGRLVTNYSKHITTKLNKQSGSIYYININLPEFPIPFKEVPFIYTYAYRDPSSSNECNAWSWIDNPTNRTPRALYLGRGNSYNSNVAFIIGYRAEGIKQT